MLGDDLRELLGGAIPTDHSRQVLSEYYIERLAVRGSRVIDVGCGEGGSVDQFRSFDAEIDWLGVDLAWSPEVARRVRADARFATFDGINIPAADRSVDAVYCKQVLEHVRAPAALLADIARVLADGGLLAGSTSQLEPYHSLSVWNYTAYGLGGLLSEAGLELIELRPGIDALTLVAHRALGMPAFSRRWWGRESPLNRAIELFGRARGLDAAGRNAVKLLLCGQFSFLARRRP
ncbi:MAG: hypothetical protein NVSMB25_03270 [Thermoleophilaceae bacterium]